MAIKWKETGYNPNCHFKKGTSGENYCYQYMPETYALYSKKILGYVAENPSPITVEYITTLKMQELLEKGLTPKQIFLAWNAGENAKRCGQGINDYNQPFDSCDYIDKAMNYYNKLQ